MLGTSQMKGVHLRKKPIDDVQDEPFDEVQDKRNKRGQILKEIFFWGGGYI